MCTARKDWKFLIKYDDIRATRDLIPCTYPSPDQLLAIFFPRVALSTTGPGPGQELASQTGLCFCFYCFC